MIRMYSSPLRVRVRERSSLFEAYRPIADAGNRIRQTRSTTSLNHPVPFIVEPGRERVRG